jgi:hypothetical protein
VAGTTHPFGVLPIICLRNYLRKASKNL